MLILRLFFALRLIQDAVIKLFFRSLSSLIAFHLQYYQNFSYGNRGGTYYLNSNGTEEK